MTEACSEDASDFGSDSVTAAVLGSVVACLEPGAPPLLPRSPSGASCCCGAAAAGSFLAIARLHESYCLRTRDIHHSDNAE